MKTHPHSNNQKLPRLIAWEVTKQCNLNCRHCRANAAAHTFPDEFSTEECKKVLDNVASFSKPIIILTGGEPMTRTDIYELSKYGSSLGLRMVMAPCGHLMTPENTLKMKESGIERISLSIDGADAQTHDSFRQVEGAFDAVIKAARIAKEAALDFQINTTITKLNYKQIDKILELAISIGAVSYHPFLLVPTGRGENLREYEIAPEEYEEILTWIYKKSLDLDIIMKPTCAPHYYRIYRQFEKIAGRMVTFESHGLNAVTRGCLGGHGFAFISNNGQCQICGFLEESAGNVRDNNYNFKNIWENSELYLKVRDIDHYNGKCGVCEYRNVCGGCRARAFASTGNYLDPEPYCVYTPHKLKKNETTD